MTSPFNQGFERGVREAGALRYRLNLVKNLLELLELKVEDYLKVNDAKLKYVPQRFLEEAEGIAKGSGLSVSEVLALDFGLSVDKLFMDGCTAFAIPSGFTLDGSVMLMKNRDLGFRRLHPQVLSYSKLDGYNRFIGVVTAGSVCWYQGVNEHGLVAFNTATPQQIIDPTSAQGMSIPVIIRRILEECSSVDEALKFISGSQFNAFSNLFLSDRERIVIVELKAGFTPYIWEVKEPDCRSNHYLFHVNPDVQDELELLVRQQTLVRYTRGRMLLKGVEKFSVETLMGFSRDHFHGPSPYSICRHPPIVGSPLTALLSSTTLSSQIFKVGIGGVEVYTAIGYPCQSEFIHTVFGESIPIEAADGRLWFKQYGGV